MSLVSRMWTVFPLESFHNSDENLSGVLSGMQVNDGENEGILANVVRNRWVTGICQCSSVLTFSTVPKAMASLL